MNDLRETQNTKRAPAPAKKWRNRYWFPCPILLTECPAHPAGWFGPGVLFPRTTWPSSDFAETQALQSIARHPKGHLVSYLGAEPVTE